MRVPLILLAGCYAALPPPRPPHIHGTVSATGGSLGTWQMTVSVAKPVDGDLDAIDVTDPAAPGRIVRIVRAAAQPDEAKGIVEHVASRGIEIRIAGDG